MWRVTRLIKFWFRQRLKLAVTCRKFSAVLRRRRQLFLYWEPDRRITSAPYKNCRDQRVGDLEGPVTRDCRTELNGTVCEGKITLANERSWATSCQGLTIKQLKKNWAYSAHWHYHLRPKSDVRIWIWPLSRPLAHFTGSPIPFLYRDWHIIWYVSLVLPELLIHSSPVMIISYVIVREKMMNSTKHFCTAAFFCIMIIHRKLDSNHTFLF